jgi:hypothetical protein
MSRYYFAYASDLDAALMERRCPGAQYRGKGFLPKHRMMFNHMSTTWGGGSADLQEDAESPGVWGAVYELTVDDWKRLVEAEGVHYKRVPFTIWEAGVEDCPLECDAFKVVDVTGPHLPSKVYHEKIVRGALARGLPAGWVTWLRGLSAKG